MSLGQNIRLFRERLGMSQEELAKKLGYKDRSTIAKIENNVNDLTQSKIVAIADVLKTTPAALMGWEDGSTTELARLCKETSKYRVENVSEEEYDVLHKYRCLDDRGKSAVRNTLEHEYASRPGKKSDSIAKDA